MKVIQYHFELCSYLKLKLVIMCKIESLSDSIMATHQEFDIRVINFTICWGERVICSIETEYRDFEVVDFVMNAGITIIVFPGAIPKHRCGETVVKLSNGRAL